MAKMGRPVLEVDWDTLERICQYTISCEDAAFLCGVGKTTLEEKIKEKHGITFRAFREQRSARTRLNLFNKQVEIALKGNVTMLIWLGKNYLKQSDKNEYSFTEDPLFSL